MYKMISSLALFLQIRGRKPYPVYMYPYCCEKSDNRKPGNKIICQLTKMTSHKVHVLQGMSKCSEDVTAAFPSKHSGLHRLHANGIAIPNYVNNNIYNNTLHVVIADWCVVGQWLVQFLIAFDVLSCWNFESGHIRTTDEKLNNDIFFTGMYG